MIVHGFSKNEQLVKQLIDNGFYISFGKYLLRNKELESVFISVPNNQFFLETDTTEEGIEAVYALAASYKGVELNDLQDILIDNYKRVFKI